MDKQGVAILGATGSIGDNTLAVLSLHPDKYNIVALSANSNTDKMFELCQKFKPQFAVMANDTAASKLEDKIQNNKLNIEVLSGQEGLCLVVALKDVDIVVAGIVGAAGLLSSIGAAKAGKKILLANKETLVMAGSLFLDEVKKNNAQLLPVDSEHNALFQCMPAGYTTGCRPQGVKKIILTASGGPFRQFSEQQLKEVTPAQASKHPTYKMGPKITVDSATLMNKGLEVIEACLLFSLNPNEIEVIVHPQSIVHSMVEYDDGSVLAELGNPDMRTPIASCLAWPKRITSGASSLDFIKAKQLEFYPPDYVKFPCLKLAFDALESGQGACAVLNASNEVAVHGFLQNKIGFTDIAIIIDKVLTKLGNLSDKTLEDINDADRRAREYALQLIKSE